MSLSNWSPQRGQVFTGDGWGTGRRFVSIDWRSDAHDSYVQARGMTERVNLYRTSRDTGSSRQDKRGARRRERPAQS